LALPRARLLAVVLVLLPAPACRRHETAATAERAVLERRGEGIAALVKAAQAGTLLPFDKLLVVADEGLVAQVIAATLPFETVVGGRYRVSVTRAEVHFEDGFALVRLDGEARFADRPASDGYAEVTVYGGLDVVDLDPESGVLRGRVHVIALDARKVNVLGVQASVVEELVESLGRERLDSFGVLVSRIEIPVRIEGKVALPAVGPGEVKIEAATVPVRASVADVKAFRGKLWVSVDVAGSGAATPIPKVSP
jgi:hypothetical protein